jgi:hypothetical protein
MLMAVIGMSFSFPQTTPPKDPFSEYLAKVKESKTEPSLERFAKECGLDPSTVQARFAVGPGSSFSQVQSLSKGLRSIATDFYSTAEIWTAENRALVEIWANSDDVGSEVRYYKCFESGKLIRAEVIEWNLPVAQRRTSSAGDTRGDGSETPAAASKGRRLGLSTNWSARPQSQNWMQMVKRV